MAQQPSAQPSKTGIFLDVPYTHTIFATAYSEGYAAIEPLATVITETGVRTTRPSLQQRIISQGSDPERRKIALEMLVVYEKCYLTPHIGVFDIDALVERGLAEYSPYPLAPQINREFNNRNARALAPLILQVLSYRGLEIDRQRFEQALDTDKRQIFEIVDRTSRLPDSSSNLPQIASDRLAIEVAFDEIADLIWQSNRLECPALTVLGNAKEEIGGTSISTTQFAEGERIVAGIFLRGLKHVSVNSLADVEKYRDNVNISDFRTEVNECIEGIREGKLSYEKVEQKIKKANACIARLDTLTRVGQWLTYMSVPVSLISLWAQFPLGLITAPIGTSLLATGTLLKRDLRWTLLSR
jgi:hypothetical protein